MAIRAPAIFFFFFFFLLQRAPAISKTEYEVFLSFRGPDTRQGFTDVLYNHLIESGIQVFRDDDELAIGDKIELILDAITNSKICVPIFSKSFASSAWCLREVAKMVELNKVIVPIFYDVIVDDVKLKTPLYADHLKEHQQKYGKDQVVEWEKALKEVTRIKGRELKKDMGVVIFNKQFTAEILLKLGGKQTFTIYHSVEMTDQTKEAMDLLDIQSADVLSLGLYGMGGIGKTTLAKTIFNQISSNFDACSFLANIRQELSTSKGLESLQTKLLQDLSSKADGADRMKSSLRMKKVLIVLDDVSERSHIRELIGEPISFGSGSRIIITTRDERVVKNFMQASSSSDEGSTKVSPRIEKMEITGMNSKQAMQLFSGHAFGSNSPPQDYLSLSNEVISICAGLPLALEVIGSLLCGMSKESWIAKISKLKKIPEEGVQEKLMISYEALKDDEKEIFLDIACFFINGETAYPTYMWEACGFSPDWAVPILLSMSLVKITDGRFQMHDQLRDLGVEIITIKGFNSLTPRGSRIKSYEDASSVLERQQGKEVVGLCLGGSDRTDLTTFEHQTDLTTFKNLRLLGVEREVAVGKFWQLPENVRWLSISLVDPSLIVAIRSKVSAVLRNRNNSYLLKLAVLQLKRSSISDNWDGWILIQKLQGLKVLDLGRCERLTTTPNFSKMVALEHLILNGCSNLVKIHSSIGKLLKLKHLDLGNCTSLQELPEEVGHLEDVEHINLNSANISTLPDSIGKLKNLKVLTLRSCERLGKLPECIEDLGSLVHLDMSSSKKLKELPANIGRLVKLEYLSLESCEGISNLPDSIGDLTSLVSLRLSGCDQLEGLPSSITRLVKLEKLDLSFCRKIVQLPNDFSNLKSLVELELRGTGVAIYYPETIRDFKTLKVIPLEKSAVRVLPETIGQLISHRGTQPLIPCRRIERSPNLPTSWNNLHVELPKLTQLKELFLDGPIWPQARIEPSVPAESSSLLDVKTLSVSCSNLKSIMQFPSSLQSLTLEGARKEMKLPSLSNLNNLTELYLLDFLMEEEEGFQGLGVERLGSLRKLTVRECNTIDKFPDLSQLKCLEELCVEFCEKLVEIPGLGILISLKRLKINNCKSLKSLENMKNLTRLENVEIFGCGNFRGIEGFQGPPHSKVSIS